MNFSFRGRHDTNQTAYERVALLEAQHERERFQTARLLTSEERLAAYTSELLGTKQASSLAIDSLRLTLHRKPVLGGVLNYSEDDVPLRTIFDIGDDTSLEIVTYSFRERLRFRFARAAEGFYLDANGNHLPLNTDEAQAGIAAAEEVCQRLGDLCVSRAA